ncbi:MAG: AtpZ/AtpI family protein [Candidatus Gracilibacteria bacterium]|jgi:F0F1-type ATP synthase assembly protein I|nr:AtpZ/AtpI family protein [Candidatus Gracilibacteria bacterium]
MEKKNNTMTAFSLALNLGYMIVVPILLFGVSGVFVDKYFDLFPIFTLIGFVFAMGSGLLVVYVKTKDLISGNKLLKK